MGTHELESSKTNTTPRAGQRSFAVVGSLVCRWMTIVAVVGAIAAGACSTGQQQPDDSWMRGYLDDPDRVWNATLLVLDDLSYSVEEKNRVDGTIRAVAVGDVPYRGVVLGIDQIMRTDIVRVHVVAGAGSGGQQPDAKVFEGAAGGFLDALDTMLGVN